MARTGQLRALPICGNPWADVYAVKSFINDITPIFASFERFIIYYEPLFYTILSNQAEDWHFVWMLFAYLRCP